MKNLMLVVGVVGLVGFAACGGDDRANPVGQAGSSQSGTGNRPNAGGESGTSAGGSEATGGSGMIFNPGGSDGEGGTDTGGAPTTGGPGPDVELTSPAAVADPDVGPVLVGNDVLVVCRATASDEPGALPVDPSTVRLSVLDAAGEPALGIDQLPLEKPGDATGNADEYSASFTLQSLPSGRVSLRCVARDTSGGGVGSATLATFVDHGPTIEVHDPELNSAHKLEGAMSVEFSVAPVPLASGDSQAEVASILLRVAGVEIPATEDTQRPGTYQATVDFSNKLLFPQPPPTHTALRVEATNKRAPTAAVGVVDHGFILDSTGPVIAFTSPLPNGVVHGEETIIFTVNDDGAGVDLDTIQLTMTGVPAPVPYEPDETTVWERNGNSFAYHFNTGDLIGVQAQISVSVQAKDNAANGADGVTLILYLDDFPPRIDLDAGNARGVDNTDKCSSSFDPLGDALNDGAKTNESFNLLRAIVLDNTNSGSGLDVRFMSGTDQGSARLYFFQPTAGEPFLVDRSGDGVCDDLARQDFEYQSLGAIRKAGTLTYSSENPGALPVPGSRCVLQNLPPPLKLCEGASDLSVVIQHDVETKGDEPVVYAPGGNSGGFLCTGSEFDLGLQVPGEGWICFAARAQDLQGNVGISRPLRVCFDDPLTPSVPPCWTDDEPMPDCTTDCTAPAPIPPHIYRF